MCKTGDELTKNRREDDEGFEGGMMFEKAGLHCPVTSLVLYIKHHNPKNEFLFQRPKKGSKIGVDDVCFDNMEVGERTLGEKMKCISKEAELSKDYTNHSIRATSVTILDKCGYEVRHIMAVSGHKSESSIRSYCKTDTKTKKQMLEGMAAATAIVLPENNVPSSPMLSLSQEEFLMREVCVSTSTTQVSKTYNVSNCNVIFNN